MGRHRRVRLAITGAEVAEYHQFDMVVASVWRGWTRADDAVGLLRMG